MECTLIQLRLVAKRKNEKRKCLVHQQGFRYDDEYLITTAEQAKIVDSKTTLNSR